MIGAMFGRVKQAMTDVLKLSEERLTEHAVHTTLANKDMQSRFGDGPMAPTRVPNHGL
jgi:hypothetical protein